MKDEDRLGDRHGENILFDSTNGDVVHVDFNCLFDKGRTFEVSENVPFRLTHNLVSGLGITGVEGVFRRASEVTMGILRNNKDSLMSVLETFVHDPLVDWMPSVSKRKVSMIPSFSPSFFFSPPFPFGAGVLWGEKGSGCTDGRIRG